MNDGKRHTSHTGDTCTCINKAMEEYAVQEQTAVLCAIDGENKCLLFSTVLSSISLISPFHFLLWLKLHVHVLFSLLFLLISCSC